MADIRSLYVIAKRNGDGSYTVDERFDTISLYPWQVKDLPAQLRLWAKDSMVIDIDLADGSFRFERYVDKQWREREQDRFRSGIYEQLPHSWQELPREAATLDHYAHISIESDICVAFTADETKGQRDIQTRMRPGRYLTRYFPGLDSDKIRDLACEIDKAGEFKLATTRSDIRRVYRRGPSSCMCHSLDHFSSHVHPVEVYAAGDLAVAYLGDIDARISARALCWPDKKAYSIIYGDTHRLGAALKLAGYERGSLAGAKLLKIYCENDRYPDDTFVMPYIDTHRHFTHHEDGKHFIVADCGEYAAYTHGLSVK